MIPKTEREFRNNFLGLTVFAHKIYLIYFNVDTQHIVCLEVLFCVSIAKKTAYDIHAN